MSKLILVRHGKSAWNELGLWTGWKDIPLNEQGILDATKAGQQLKDIRIDIAYTSKLQRAKQTLDQILKTLSSLNSPTSSIIPLIETEAVNERNYGIYTGKNKWEVKEQLGEEEFQKLRRSWEYPIPEGETMKDVYNRIVPYYQQTILPQLKEGKNIIIVAHGNSLRALVKYLEDLSEEQLSNLEFGIGEVYIYDINKEGEATQKQIRAENPNRGKV